MRILPSAHGGRRMHTRALTRPALSEPQTVAQRGMTMNALALFGASFSIPFFATFVRSERARKDLTIVASFAAIGMLVSVLALIDDSMGLTAWFGLTVPPVEFLD